MFIHDLFSKGSVDGQCLHHWMETPFATAKVIVLANCERPILLHQMFTLVDQIFTLDEDFCMSSKRQLIRFCAVVYF